MGSRSLRMQLFALAVILQLAMQSVPSVSLGLDDSAYWAKLASGQQSMEQTSERTGNYFKADLKYFQHSMTNLSLTERVRMAVERSQQRLAYFHSLTSKQPVYQPEASYRTSVKSNQGSYLMTLQIGTPARAFIAIADTGSDLVWIQGLPCRQCFQQPSALFDPAESSTYRTTTCSESLCLDLPKKTCPTVNSICQYSYAYGDQSTTQGDFAFDTVTLTASSGSSQAFPNFGFGVGHSNQGTFVDTDGLIGLGQGPLSLVSQLGSNFGNVFSYCLVDFYSSSSSDLLFGSTGGSAGYTPLLKNAVNPTFYYVKVVGILVAGENLIYPDDTFAISSSGAGGFILDSGTTVTQLPQGAYAPLLSSLDSKINYPRVTTYVNLGFDLCYDLSNEQSPSVPSVVFKFEGVDVDLPGNNIFLQVDNAGTFCLAMQGSPFSLGIFGNVQQQNFDIVHDRANSRVGFTPKKC